MTTSLSQFDGPRLMRAQELIASDELAHICFGGTELVDKEEAPASYIPPRRGGIYILADQGRLVSRIGVTHFHLQMYAATIQVASIGGVCTHPDYRGQGLASHLLDYCTQKLAQEGARLMLISGTRGLYTRLGNVPHGLYHCFSIKPGEFTGQRPSPAGLALRRLTGDDALTVSRLYQAEPVHFIRKISDFSETLQDPSRNTFAHADPWLVERSGHALAYLFLGTPWGQALEVPNRHVSEYAGSRLALVDALQALLAAGNLQEIYWPVAWQDVELVQMFQDCGLTGRLSSLDGQTLRIVNFPGLMKDLRPILQARLGKALLRGLRFMQSGPLLGGSGSDRYAIVRGGERLDLDGAAMTRLVMGDAGSQAQPIRLSGALAEIIPAIFPLPSFLFGLNYR